MSGKGTFIFESIISQLYALRKSTWQENPTETWVQDPWKIFLSSHEKKAIAYKANSDNKSMPFHTLYVIAMVINYRITISINCNSFKSLLLPNPVPSSSVSRKLSKQP